MTTIEEVRELFAKDRFATQNGATVEEIGDHSATCSIHLEPMHKNAMGAVMGGVYFTLADFAFAVASNWQEPGVVSLNSNITFMGAAKGEVLTATAECIKNGRSTCHYRVEVKDELGTLCSVVTITGYRLQ